ncbi:MAG: helix-turn-helix domain-containing protein [Bacteroidetes bacterium]|nr:helix-turn-helix domain-containing protein [Bacteroidota bacterium]
MKFFHTSIILHNKEEYSDVQIIRNYSIYQLKTKIFLVYKIKQMESKNQNAILINLGSTLRQLRMRKGFKSAEVFSFENELNRTAYWRWENGKNITMKNLLRLCDIHKISPKELFEIIENKYNRNFTNELLNEPESVILKSKYKRTKYSK